MKHSKLCSFLSSSRVSCLYLASILLPPNPRHHSKTSLLFTRFFFTNVISSNVLSKAVSNSPNCLTSLSLNSPDRRITNTEGLCVDKMRWCVLVLWEIDTGDTHLRPLSHAWTFPGSLGLALGCTITSYLSRSKQPLWMVSRMFQHSELTPRPGRIHWVSASSKKGPTTCLQVCVLLHAKLLWKKMYNDLLAAFLHGCSKESFCCARPSCQSWKLLFPAQHPSLAPWKPHPSFLWGSLLIPALLQFM